MIVTYSKGTIQLTPEGDEIAICDYIFSRPDGVGLLTFHVGELLKQRNLQQVDELKNQLLNDHLTSISLSKVAP